MSSATYHGATVGVAHRALNPWYARGYSKATTPSEGKEDDHPAAPQNWYDQCCLAHHGMQREPHAIRT